jgi:hypothetical protein
MGEQFLKPGVYCSFRADILRGLHRFEDYPVFLVLEVQPSPIDLTQQVARVVDAHGFYSVLSRSLLAKIDNPS